ncbi:uncharacterized protein LOC127104085 [Lathyrus oleraceus]|uniref:uncharacterized protein LOC127104085 n=1 Tax=Pisum sativum TaxID=3888 RepID=UPI0021CFBD3B|nr:uncharacterized protein LOC127104085 [Pisum sativum]
MAQCDAIDDLCAIQLQTVALYARGKEMRSLDSLDFAPSAPNHNSPLMELESAVEIGTVLDVEKHKQMEHMYPYYNYKLFHGYPIPGAAKTKEPKNPEFLQSRAILAGTIETVDIINQYILGFIPGEEKEYLSSDSVDTFDGEGNGAFDVLTPEFLNTLTTSGLPNHKIKLKIGTPIMLLRNIDQPEGLCNGTRLIVTRLANHVIEAKIISGKNIGGVIYIPRMDMTPTQSLWPFKMTRRQFPITTCYAMTINKSQGQSLDYVGLYLPRSVFGHGQLYVAISRVKSKKGLKILIHDKDNHPLNSTTNVMFKEVFENL